MSDEEKNMSFQEFVQHIERRGQHAVRLGNERSRSCGSASRLSRLRPT
jgi:hypothetical protein